MLKIPQDAPTQAVQAPSPGWTTTLITALSSLLVGVVVGSSLEYIRPRLARRVMTKFVTDELVAEVTADMDEIFHATSGYELRGNVPREMEPTVLASQYVVASSISSEAYDHYLKEERGILYKIDFSKNLAIFHRTLNAVRELIVDKNHKHANHMMQVAMLRGKAFLKEMGVPFKEPTRGPENEVHYP